LSKARRRVRIPRSIEPGATRSSREGAKLTCLILATYFEECLGIDLASGAFVRILGMAPPGTPRPGAYRAVEISIGRNDEPFDPTRPELVVAAGARILGEVRGRRVRRLFAQLEARNHLGATVVSSRGPSIAYVDLDGSTPSIAMIRARTASLEAAVVGSSVLLGVSFGGVRQRLPVYDPRVIRAASRAAPRPLLGAGLVRELGYEPSHVLVGLGDVNEGHVRKVVFALLARSQK
jgi:hypothetical protein